MKTTQVQNQIRRIRRLAIFQRLVRYLLRGAWAGGAVYLLLWGSNEIWGWPDDSRIWLGAGILVSLVIAVRAILPLPRLRRVIWAMDRRLSLREQVSTAWETIEKGAEGLISGLLLNDLLALLPEVRQRISRRGWYLRREVETALIVFILFALVFLSGITTAITLAPSDISLLPPLGSDPLSSDVFPGGLPGLEIAGLNEGGEGDMTFEDYAEIAKALEELGEDLEDQAATSELAEELKEGDLEGAAQALENLADRLDELSEETRQELADALDEAADKLELLGEEDLAESLREAADALRDHDDSKAGELLDEIASELRNFDNMLDQLAATPPGGDGDGEPGTETLGGGGGEAGAGLGPGGSQSGEGETIPRIVGEGSSFDIGGEEGLEGMLQPGLPYGEEGSTIVDEIYDFILAGSAEIYTGILSPFHYHWSWRDVVSSYFSP